MSGYIYRRPKNGYENGNGFQVDEFYSDGRFRHSYMAEADRSGYMLWLTPMKTSREERENIFRPKKISIYELKRGGIGND